MTVLALNLAGKRAYTITDEKGRRVTLAAAKQLWENGKVENWNIAFSRLPEFDWDIEKVKEYYS